MYFRLEEYYEKITELITDIVKNAFATCNYSAEYGMVTISNRYSFYILIYFFTHH